MSSLLPTLGGEIDVVELRAQQDAMLCAALLEEVLERSGLGHGDLGGQWSDVRKTLIMSACTAAAHVPTFEHSAVLRGRLQEDVARLHVRAVVRASVAVLVDGAVSSFSVSDGEVVINGVPDELLDTSPVQSAIEKLVVEFREHPRRMCIRDYLRNAE